MSRIAMCIDCPNYQKGGYCRHTKKDVGALSPACDHALTLNEKFNPEDEDAALEQATPRKELEDKAERSQKRREARAAKRVDEGKAPAPMAYTIPEVKHCPHCGRDLPISEYYMREGKPNWICKECTKAYNTQKAKEARAARAAANAGATTKVCKTCGRELPLDAFGSHKLTCDGKNTVCRECVADKMVRNAEKARRANPTPAPVLDEGIKTVNTPPADEPILLADIDTFASLENFESKRLVEELRARGYTVTCSRPITIIEEL